MQLLTLGLNHTTAPLALRERLAFPSEQIAEALRSLAERLHHVRPATPVETTILSTCNRTELYYAAARQEPLDVHQDPVIAGLAHWLAETHRMPLSELAPHLYTHTEADAVRHAFRVGSGLDSMVLGETQILGQMKRAVREASAAGALGTHLHHLFQRTFSVAKEVRSSTEIGTQSVSMAAAAVRLAQRIFERISEQSILFIGAGEMIELAATHFAAKEPKSMAIANRTVERGERLANRLGARTIRLSELPEHLAEFDIVVSCTASSLPIIGLGLVERATRLRRHKPMFMVDLAVPRDIEAEAGLLDDVFLYTLDDLGAMVQSGSENRLAAVSQAEAIIEQQVRQFMRWLGQRSVVPVIRELHEHGEALRQLELERARRMLAKGENPEVVLEALSQMLTNKFLHGPTRLLHDIEHADATPLPELLRNLHKTSR